jgi:hypothetical protein
MTTQHPITSRVSAVEKSVEGLRRDLRTLTATTATASVAWQQAADRLDLVANRVGRALDELTAAQRTPRLTYTVSLAARALSVDVATVEQLIATGELDTIDSIRHKPVIPAQSLHDLVARTTRTTARRRAS